MFNQKLFYRNEYFSSNEDSEDPKKKNLTEESFKTRMEPKMNDAENS